MKKRVNLYSLSFFMLIFFDGGIGGLNSFKIDLPFWLIWLFPLTWIILLPIYFFIYSIVVNYLFKKLEIVNKKDIYKVIFKSTVMGLICDILLILFTFITGILIYGLLDLVFGDFIYYQYLSGSKYLQIIHFYKKYEICVAILDFILISRIIYYKINMRFNIASLDIDGKNSDLAKYIAIFTAPYFFILPNQFLYLLTHLK